MTERDFSEKHVHPDQADQAHPAVREQALVNPATFESYRYVAGQLTESGMGAYLVMEDPKGKQADFDKVPVIVVSPHRRSDAFWETAHGLAHELKGVAKDRIAEVRQRFVAGKIAHIRAETMVYGSNPYANPHLRNPNQH
ncbi:MAG: hypothetical protein A2171_02300 [Candidatus Levybacteria bacterium RBG_13_35_9]|nr:MAG: hypothetical protein A2171_02300 [Candidatus Levybacteria bacterium RBG_13_35_9]